ncbi:acetyltransferase [Helicobacter muridarum]|uniref:Acetyltransferase n=1 Tax=Helicobacter muridarum TaxID=216 RepID=A0A4U8TE41_9HELI|nr:NeuD/PglB/VioB family sugar acetyltransferase [Helicobacter muridarum]TLD98285.1 acetyltransferase [Helicobacter muridarum]
MKEKLIIIGGGGHACACLDIITMIKHFDIIGIIDSYLANQNIKSVHGYEILGDEEMLSSFAGKKYSVFVAIGQIKTAKPRISIYNKLKSLGFKLPSIISPLAYVSSRSILDEGSIVMHNALINANVRIGKMAIINSKALVEHDCVIGDFCHISTASVVNGACQIGNEVFLGSNMILKHKSNISNGSILYCNPLELRYKTDAYNKIISIQHKQTNNTTKQDKLDTGGGGAILLESTYTIYILYTLLYSYLFLSFIGRRVYE